MLINCNILDTLMNSEHNVTYKKSRDEPNSSPCKKRRRSYKISCSEEAPPKRGRKPNRSRHNSDSDDTSEHSLPPSSTLSSAAAIDSRYCRSPRQRKYNFFVDFGKCIFFLQKYSFVQNI